MPQVGMFLLFGIEKGSNLASPEVAILIEAHILKHRIHEKLDQKTTLNYTQRQWHQLYELKALVQDSTDLLIMSNTWLYRPPGPQSSMPEKSHTQRLHTHILWVVPVNLDAPHFALYLADLPGNPSPVMLDINDSLQTTATSSGAL